MRCLLILALLVPGVTRAQCDCIALSAKQAKRGAEIVFRGTVESLRGSGAKAVVVFRVARVWKGHIPPVFEMPGIESDGWCHGFLPGLLARGNDLIVFAAKIDGGGPPNDYFPFHCQTNLVTRSHSSRELGRGRKPRPPRYNYSRG